MPSVILTVTKHLGAERLYFADPRTQKLYEAMSGRKTVGKEALAFLERLGIETERESSG